MQTTSQPRPQGATPGPTPGLFAPTQWTLVLAARDETSAQAALAELCGIYWYPIYAYARRSGLNQEDAQDMTQEFFARLLAKNWLSGVDREKGRFRSFLLASLRHFMSNERDRASAAKRGGGLPLLSLDAVAAEARYHLEPADTTTPDRLFDRQWALTLLDRVLARLRSEFVATGKVETFDALKPALAGAADPYANIAAATGLSEGAVKVAIHRLRKRYRQILREEIAQTVSTPEEVDEEIRALFAALS